MNWKAIYCVFEYTGLLEIVFTPIRVTRVQIPFSAPRATALEHGNVFGRFFMPFWRRHAQQDGRERKGKAQPKPRGFRKNMNDRRRAIRRGGDHCFCLQQIKTPAAGAGERWSDGQRRDPAVRRSGYCRSGGGIAGQSNSELWRAGERRKLRWSPFWRTSSCARCPKRRGEEGSCSR